MSTRIVESYVCDQCAPREVECEPVTVAGFQFQLCARHLKPVLAFQELAKHHGRKVQPQVNGAARSQPAERVMLAGVEYVVCQSCPGAKPIRVASRYLHARNVHQKATGEIKWLPAV